MAQLQFNYTTSNGTITITKYTGPGHDATIPDTIDGLPVTSIGRDAFRAWFQLVRVRIPNSVTTIGDGVFSDCRVLTNVTIPESVTSIGAGAFAACSKLTSINIPAGLTNLGAQTFFSCNLKTITVDALNPVYRSSADGVLFNHDQTKLIQYPQGRSGSYTIPDSVTNVGKEAFYWCGGLTNITIPTSVSKIEGGTFGYCTNLTSITIPSSIGSIGGHAFVRVPLTGITIPASVTNIDPLAFDLCNLTAITVDTNNPAYSSLDGVLFDKSQTTLVHFPQGKAGSYAIPDSVVTIGEFAFEHCRTLTEVTIPNSVTEIGKFAFCECPGLTTVTIPNSVTRIGPFAFEACSSLIGLYFQGNAPGKDVPMFDSRDKTTVYHLPDTTGWGATFGGRPTAVWKQ